MSRLSNGWSMMKASYGVLRMDPELAVFPILSGIATILVTSTFILPLVLAGGGLGALEGLGERGGSYLLYMMVFLYYLVLYFLVFFFNTALVGAALIRLEGGDPSVRDGLDIAFNRLGAILEYAAVAATVGMLLRTLEERAGFIGRMVIGLIGLAWTLATYLTVPVLVSRDVGAIDAVKESASLFKKTWGEQMVGNVGFGLVTFLILLAMVAVMVPLIVLASAVSPVLLAVVGVSFAGGVLCLMVVTSALKGVYSAALYRYATTGDPGGPFNAEMMSQAFRPGKRRW